MNENLQISFPSCQVASPINPYSMCMTRPFNEREIPLQFYFNPIYHNWENYPPIIPAAYNGDHPDKMAKEGFDRYNEIYAPLNQILRDISLAIIQAFLTDEYRFDESLKSDICDMRDRAIEELENIDKLVYKSRPAPTGRSIVLYDMILDNIVDKDLKFTNKRLNPIGLNIFDALASIRIDNRDSIASLFMDIYMLLCVPLPVEITEYDHSDLFLVDLMKCFYNKYGAGFSDYKYGTLRVQRIYDLYRDHKNECYISYMNQCRDIFKNDHSVIDKVYHDIVNILDQSGMSLRERREVIIKIAESYGEWGNKLDLPPKSEDS